MYVNTYCLLFKKVFTETLIIFIILGRDFAYSIAHIYIGSLMLEFAQTTKNDLDVDLSYIWSVTRNSSSDLLSSVLIKNSTEDFDKIVYEGYEYDMENSSSNTVKIQ